MKKPKPTRALIAPTNKINAASALLELSEEVIAIGMAMQLVLVRIKELEEAHAD